jgi:hypothetical protein
MSLQEFKDKFDKEVNTSHIKYDHDGGHSYSYIDHPIMEFINDSSVKENQMNELEEYAYNWLYSHDECPPCILDGGCGCNESDDNQVA